MRLSAVIALALVAGCHDPRSKPTPAAADGATVFSAQAYDVSPPLRELAKLPRLAAREENDHEMERVMPNPWAARLNAPESERSGEAIMQRAIGPAAIPTTLQNFEGLGAGLAGTNPGGFPYPPDTDGAVGPNHYVQVVNQGLAVFSKTGTVMMGPMDTSMVWSGFAGICSTNGYGDGVVRYDQLADRWVISQFAFVVQGQSTVAPYIQCIAISTSPDPTGTYTRYQYSFDNNLNDYPKIAMWPDAYYLTYNIFPNGTSSNGAKVCAMDRTKMIAGDSTATTQCFSLTNDFGLLVSDLDGKTLPPTGAPVHIVDLNDGTSLDYFSLHVDFATPANSKLSAASTITVPAYTAQSTRVATKNGNLDTLSDRAMNRFVYRNFGDHEALVLAHSITTGVRWYEIRTPATPTVFQSGTYAPDATTRWMPSIAMDSVGDIALVYTATSSTTFASIKYAARASTDPAGTLGYSEGTLATGYGTNPSNITRWGDYASINIDPTDDCTFWATHEYYAMGKTSWSTRIASFTLPSCSSFALAQPDAETVAQAGTATYTITTSTTAGAAQSVALTATGLPTGVTASFNPATVMSGATSQITLTADPTAAIGSASYQVVATGTSAQMQTVALTVTAKPATPDAGMNGSDGNGNGSEHGGCCNVDHSSPAGATFLVMLVGLALGRRRRRR